MARMIKFSSSEHAVIEAAVIKLRDEAKAKKGGKNDLRASLVLTSVVDALEHFCYQSTEFAKVVLDSKKTVYDCCKDVLKGVGNSISDLEVYRRVVQCYFPGAQIDMQMKIILCEGVVEPIESSKLVVLNLLDF